MPMIDHLRKQFRYDDWANREVLKALRSGASERSVKLMAHIVAAQALWLDRIHAAENRLVWPDWALDECQEQQRAIADRWSDYMKDLTQEEMRREVRYTNSKGEHYSSGVEDILQHVLMHSAYHRGQIATDMRASGFTPAYTDYIQAVRTGQLGP